MRHARADDQSVTALQTSQIYTLSSQLCEAQRQTEALRNQLTGEERCCQNAECRADRSELMGMILGSQGRKLYPCHLPSPPRVHPHGSRCRFRQEIHYADGGRSTRYLASDDDDAEVQGSNDSPGTRRYTFEENDQPKTSDHSSKPSCSSLLSTSQDDPIMVIVPPTSIATTGTPLRYPSLEV